MKMPRRFLVTLLIATSVLSTVRAQGGRGAPVELPDGEGKQLVQALCAAWTCGNATLDPVARGSGRDRESSPAELHGVRR